MSIHKEGYKILAFGFILLLILNIIVNIIWSDIELVKWAFMILLIYVLCFSSVFLQASGQAS